MKTIPELRKHLKAIGYNIKTKSLSFGTHASYFKIRTGKEYPSIFTHETLKEWQVLRSFLDDNLNELKELKKSTGIIGLIK